MISWAEYRASYDDLPLAVHRGMYDGLVEQNRHQRRFSQSLVERFMSMFGPKHVVELGGWDGELASLILPGSAIESWTNFELANVDVVCEDDRFTQVVSDEKWAWDHEKFAGDCFVSSHCLEHLSVDQVELLLDRLDVETKLISAYIQVPLPEDGTPDWEQWPNSGHILQMNAGQLDEAFMRRGWNMDTGLRMGIDMIRWWKR